MEQQRRNTGQGGSADSCRLNLSIDIPDGQFFGKGSPKLPLGRFGKNPRDILIYWSPSGTGAQWHKHIRGIVLQEYEN